MLNARIRKRWRMDNFPIGVVGDIGDLRYDAERLGGGAETLQQLVAGKLDFAKLLKDAERPMIIVGQGALARADGAAILALAAELATAVGAVSADWNGFGVLHTAASRVGGLDLGFVPGTSGKDLAGMAVSLDVAFLLGADEFDMNALGSAFTVYIGSHGDAGAHRADVILPGATYTEKSGIFVNTEGRVQMANRAGFAPGEAKEDWAILRALSDVLRPQAAVRFAAATAREALCRTSAFCCHRRDCRRRHRPAFGAEERRIRFRQGGVHVADQRLLPDQPDRARFRRDGRVLRARAGWLQAGSRIGQGQWNRSSRLMSRPRF